MAATTETIWALVQVYLQTLGLALLFIGTGSFIYRTCLARCTATEPLSLCCGRAFFLGLSAFLLVFVVSSRVLGSARSAVWLCLIVMEIVSLWHGMAARSRMGFWWRPLLLLSALLILVALFSITNATLWLTWNAFEPSHPPRVWTCFGSIHSGRYANYALFLAEHDRVPYLAQNAGQSLLCAVHLLLGADCPLVDLMVWVPFSLAFLTLLLFGFFRSQRFPFGACVASTFLVLYCNVALSLVHVLVFDNGSPLGFIGYTDLIVAVATFLLMIFAVRDTFLADPRSRLRQKAGEADPPSGEGGYAPGASSLVLPALLGVTWCWYAPHNIVIAAVSCLGMMFVWCWRHRQQGFRPLATLVLAGVVFAASVGFGATQLGTFLPHSLREDVGTEVFLIDSQVRFRPYSQYVTSHWTQLNCNVLGRIDDDGVRRPHLYEDTYRQAEPVGQDEIVRSITWVFENHLWATLRIYCFPLLGFFLLGMSLRAARAAEADQECRTWRIWWLLSVLAFATGFAISYGLELGGLKWLLTRFLVPGSVLGLMCLACALMRYLQNTRVALRVVLWGVLLLVATLGPMFDLASAFYRNYQRGRSIDPIGHRLNLMVQTKGPYRK